MSIGLEGFRQAKGDRLVLVTDVETGKAKGVTKAELTFDDRRVAWRQG